MVVCRAANVSDYRIMGLREGVKNNFKNFLFLIFCFKKHFGLICDIKSLQTQIIAPCTKNYN